MATAEKKTIAALVGDNVLNLHGSRNVLNLHGSCNIMSLLCNNVFHMFTLCFHLAFICFHMFSICFPLFSPYFRMSPLCFSCFHLVFTSFRMFPLCFPCYIARVHFYLTLIHQTNFDRGLSRGVLANRRRRTQVARPAIRNNSGSQESWVHRRTICPSQ